MLTWRPPVGPRLEGLIRNKPDKGGMRVSNHAIKSVGMFLKQKLICGTAFFVHSNVKNAAARGNFGQHSGISGLKSA